MKKFVYLLFLLLPFIDLGSSITARFLDVSISIGGIIKGLLLVFLVIYSIFLTKSKYKKITIVYIILAFLFSILYLVFKPINSFSNLFNEINYLVKFLFFPISFFSFLCLFDDIGFEKEIAEKLMLYTIIIYSVLLILPILTGTSFNTYENGLYGMVGWFYAANEVSTILVLLFPFSYLLISNKRKYLFLGILPILLVISYVGTKVTLFGLVIVGFIVLIISYLYNKKIFKNPFISSLIVFIVILMVNFGSYTIDNLFAVLDTPSETEEIYECINCETLPGDSLLTKIKKYGLRLLSQRNYFLKNTNEIYSDNFNAETLLFGLGFNNNAEINNGNVTKLIEMDILDIFYHMGILAIILFLIPFIFLLYLLIKDKFKLNKNRVFYILMILMSLGISTVAGHVYMAPAVSIYVVVYCMFLASELNAFEKAKINDKKIAFLALHMGYGGVENAIASQASMLSSVYEVEIISLYKQNYDIPFKLGKKVKITYLMNTVSNREEFISNLKSFHLIKTFKEGIKSLYILINKNSKIIKYIMSSDAKVIISTRYEFSKLLNKFGNKDAIKVSEQHVYDVSDEYIAKLNKLKNIDYLMPVSKYLYDQYKDKVNIKMNFIPLSLNYFPKNNEISKVDNKNLIAIGRLDKIKGFVDLIKIMQIIVKQDNSVHLDIFGDGLEKDELIKLIKDYKLEENIKLWGFKNQTFIKKYLQNSSLYLMTSFEESFGLVVIEAMSYGIPCIAFNSAKGVLDVIRNSENGFIINGRNNKEYASKVLEYVDMSVKNRKRLSENARLASEKYKHENISEEWIEFINYINETHNINMQEYLKKLYKDSKDSYYNELDNDLNSKKKRFIITVNPETLMMSEKDEKLKNILDGNYSFVPDGIAVVKAARKLGINVNERITGIDIAEYLLNNANVNKYSVYLFGAKEEVIQALVEKIKKEYKNIKLLGFSNGYVEDKDNVMEDIIKLKPDICMVALGIPNQEKLIYKYFDKAKKGIYIGVGGSFDVLSGSKMRAPKIFIKLNLEWLYRIITEPKRLKRFWNSNVKFMFKIKK